MRKIFLVILLLTSLMSFGQLRKDQLNAINARDIKSSGGYSSLKLGKLIDSLILSLNSQKRASGYLPVGNVSGISVDVPLSGDATLSSTGALTLANVVSSGSCTLCNLTYDAKGRITIASNGSSGTVTALAVAVGSGTNTITSYINNFTFNDSNDQLTIGGSNTGTANLTSPRILKIKSGSSTNTTASNLILNGGDGAISSGTGNGGDVNILGGTGNGGGTNGTVNINTTGNGNTNIGNATGEISLVWPLGKINSNTSDGVAIQNNAGTLANGISDASNYVFIASDAGSLTINTAATGSATTFTTASNIVYISNSVTGSIPLTLSNSATLDFPNTTTGVSDLTITVTGAVAGKPCTVGVPNGSVTATATFWCRVSSTNTVTVRFSPKATGGEDPASGVFTVFVQQ